MTRVAANPGEPCTRRPTVMKLRVQRAADHPEDPCEERRTTATRILDAAEAIFARVGYFAATIRCITQEAGVPLNLARYHFGSKAELFKAVIARRAEATCRQLEISLANALSGAAPDRQRVIIDAMVSTSVDRLAEGDDGWRNYFKLLAHLSPLINRPDLLKPFQQRYAGTLARYRKALQDATPEADEATVDWALHFVQVLVGHAFLDLRLIRHLGGAPVRAVDWDDLRQQLVAHALGGLRAQVELCIVQSVRTNLSRAVGA
jgi:AcrR family transcriptional regulator